MRKREAHDRPRVLQIGSALVDFDALRIGDLHGTASMEPKVMAVLQVLVARAPSVVTRETLIDEVWGGESGGDESLSRAISLLRKALGDHRGKHSHIETIPRRGYRLVASLQEPVHEPELSAAGLPEIEPKRTAWLVLVALIPALGLAIWLGWSGGEDPRLEGMAPAPERTIAVLPFADLSHAGDQRYFADGLAEEILNALTNVPELRVTGRTSAFAYRDRGADVRAIGLELGVRHVLEGSVRKQGDQLRITAQLVRANDGYRVWGRSFDGHLDRVFEFQEQIARSIADALEVTLVPERSDRLAPALTRSQAAYDAFLQGRDLARRFGPEEKIKATELLEQAVSLDPAFALAWAELARTEMFVPVSNPDLDYAPYISRAREAVSRALGLDPDLAMGHFAQGLIHEYELDYGRAMQSFAAAYRQDPGNPFLIIRYGYYLALIGQTGTGSELMERGLRLDPTDAAGIAQLGLTRLALGDVTEAERLLQRSFDLGFTPIGGTLALMLAERGQQDAAMALWREVGTALPGRYLPEFESPQAWEAFGRALFDQDKEAADRIATLFEEYFAQPDSRANSYRLHALVNLGRPGEAMRVFLDKPYPISAAFVFPIWRDSHGFPALRQHPDFPQFAQRIGLVDAWEIYGWPAACQRIPSLQGDDQAFRCD